MVALLILLPNVHVETIEAVEAVAAYYYVLVPDGYREGRLREHDQGPHESGSGKSQQRRENGIGIEESAHSPCLEGLEDRSDRTAAMSPYTEAWEIVCRMLPKNPFLAGPKFVRKNWVDIIGRR